MHHPNIGGLAVYAGVSVTGSAKETQNSALL